VSEFEANLTTIGIANGTFAATAFFLCTALLAVVAQTAPVELIYGSAPPDIDNHLLHLVKSYPDWLDRIDAGHLVLKTGERFAISDGVSSKTFNEILEKPDIDDMFYVPYPIGTTPKQPAKNSDPGRVRFEPLFNAMYGDCKKNEVAKKLKIIDWLPNHSGGHVAVTTVNGVDRALSRVSQELDDLTADLVKFALHPAGTYNCRAIAGSTARSMHAYGSAIDVNVNYSDYWRWGTPTAKEPVWKNQIPIEIVRIFERHGFIWGGYWYHYDTMHFEYRPELLPDMGSPRPD
jgi:hypothetical protein